MVPTGIIFLAFLASAQVHANVGPVIVQHPTETMYDTSSNINLVSLECVAVGDPPLNYWWTQNDVPLNQSTNSRLVMAGGSLTFTDPDRTADAGSYVCFANNTVGTVRSLPANLLFAYVESFSSDIPPPQMFTVGEGSCLSCSPPAHNPADIYVAWFRDVISAVQLNDRKRTMSDGRLCFAYVMAADNGEYSCHVSSQVGQTISQGAKISKGITVTTVEVDNPDVDVSTPVLNDQSVDAKVGDTVELECFFFGRLDNPYGSGYIPPTFQWVRTAPAGDRLPPSSFSGPYNQELTIRNVQSADSGTYECQAEGVVVSITLTVVEPPRWVMQLLSAQRDINTDYTFNVEATSPSGGVGYTWYRNAQPLESLAIRHRFSANHDTLTISDLVTTDTAMYQCFASNDYGEVYSAAQLEVRAFPPMFTEPMRLFQPAPQYSTVTVRCPVDGAPFPTVTWTNEENPITNSGHYNLTADLPNLVITDVASSDAGVYKCFATNKYGSANGTGSLEFKDATTITVSPTDSLVSVGEVITLRCKATHDQSLDLTYVWQRNGMQIDLVNSHRFSMGPDGNLMITDAQLQDEGEYTCDALTVADFSRKTAIVSIRGPPGPPSGLTAIIEQRTAALSWTPGLVHISPITSFTVEGMTEYMDTWVELRTGVGAGSNSVRLVSLSAYTNYTFRVYAVSEIGSGPPSDPAVGSDRTAKARPESAPTNVSGGGGNTGDLRITWDLFPQSEWNDHNVSYRIEWKRVGSETVQTGETTNPTATVYVVTEGIAQYTQYEVRVQAVNSENSGPFSSKMIIYSYQQAPVTAPTGVAANGASASTIEVTWNGVDPASFQGELVGYKLKYWTQGNDVNNANTAISMGIGTTTTIPNLTPNTRYSVLVLAYSGGGNGPESPAVSATTLQSAPMQKPTNVRATVSGTDIKVMWNGIRTSNSEETLQGYKIRYRLRGIYEEDAEMMNVQGTTTLEATIKDLQTSTTYLITVQGYSAGGDGAISEPVSVTTAKAKLGEVSDNGPGGGSARTVETLSFSLLLLLAFIHVLRHL